MTAAGGRSRPISCSHVDLPATDDCAMARNSSLRLLIYGLNYAPERTGVGKYTGEMAEWLGGAGNRIRVVTAHPYYPAWKVGAGIAVGATGGNRCMVLMCFVARYGYRKPRTVFADFSTCSLSPFPAFR